MTLNELKLDETGQIQKINCSPEVQKRFNILGFIKGSKITPTLISPSGNIRAYLIKDTLIAIRDCDSINIEIN